MAYDPDAIMVVRYATDGSERVVRDTTLPMLTPVGNCPGVPHRGHTDPMQVCPANMRDKPGEPFAVFFGDALPATDDQVARIEADTTVVDSGQLASLQRYADALIHDLGAAERQRDILGKELRAMRISEQADKARTAAHLVRITELDRELSCVTSDYEKFKRDARKMMAEHDVTVGQLRALEIGFDQLTTEVREYIIQVGELEADNRKLAERSELDRAALMVNKQELADGKLAVETYANEVRILRESLDMALTTNEKLQGGQQEYVMRTAAHDTTIDRLSTELGDAITEIGQLRADLARCPINGFVVGGVTVGGKQCMDRMQPHWPHVWGPPGTAVWQMQYARYCAGVRGTAV